MIEDETIDLVVTSPPYPMIEMWDDTFSAQDARIRPALERGDGVTAFERMHAILDAVWTEVFRMLKPGGLACINIGDATRSLNHEFRLYSNHARILMQLEKTGFVTLPDILWRKPTNAPNKFMGSGMLPAGAYVTYEHEYILIVRKGPRRAFRAEAEKQRRRESAFFWEERNVWFSDVWFDIRGTDQTSVDAATVRRSAAYPFELAYRLICMFSVKQDTVLDPFSGAGTTMAAALAAGRNAIGVEIDEQFFQAARAMIGSRAELSNGYNEARLQRHIAYAAQRIRDSRPVKHTNVHYGFPVVTGQERELLIPEILAIETASSGVYNVTYADEPQAQFSRKWSEPELEEYAHRSTTDCNRRDEEPINNRKLLLTSSAPPRHDHIPLI